MTSPSHTQISRRASNHQPVHRRPFYGKNARSFDAYTSDTRRRTYMRPLGAVIDAGLDNFSYDPDYLQPFKMPDGLSELLPDELRGDARVWQLSAAALETSLQRIDKLYQCATDFAFPPKTRPDLIHANSLPILERERADTPPLSFTWLDHSSITARPSPLPITVPDLDTPPLTPVVTNSSGDEILSERTSLNDVILSEPRSATCSLSSWDVPSTASASADDFDEMSWEIYLRRYHANLDDVHEAHRRLKGYGRRINTLCSELSHSGTASAKSTLLELMRWWGPMERVQTEDFDRRVAEIDTPDVNLVRMEWQSMHR